MGLVLHATVMVCEGKESDPDSQLSSFGLKMESGGTGQTTDPKLRHIIKSISRDTHCFGVSIHTISAIFSLTR